MNKFLEAFTAGLNHWRKALVGMVLLISIFGSSSLLAAPIAVVSNSIDDTVSLIDTATNTLYTTIDTMIPVDSWPISLAITPDGAFAYLLIGGIDPATSLIVINIATETVDATIPLPFLQAGGISITPDGAFVYAEGLASLPIGIGISVINTATNTVYDFISLPQLPGGVVFTPDGEFAYVSGMEPGSSTVSIIDTAMHTVNTNISVSDNPSFMAITPDSEFIYVTHWDDAIVSVINTATDTVDATITVGSPANSIAITPDGAFVYVVHKGAGANTVSVINTANNNVETTIAVGDSPRDIAITPDGAYAYVTNYFDNTVSVINTETATVDTTFSVGNGPSKLKFAANTEPEPTPGCAYSSNGSYDILLMLMLISGIFYGRNAWPACR